MKDFSVIKDACFSPQWQVPVCHGLLYVLHEAQPALTHVAARGDLHHSAGLAAHGTLERMDEELFTVDSFETVKARAALGLDH